MEARNTIYVAGLWLLLVQFVICTTEQDAPKGSKLYSCLQNCAYCVQFWEYGLYNGRRCAKRCLRQQGREVVDPDCNNPKMFNYSPRIIDLLMEMQNQADEPDSNDDQGSSEEEDSGLGAIGGETTVLEVKNRSERRAPSIGGHEEQDHDHHHQHVREDDIKEHYKVEIKAEHRRKSKHGHGTTNTVAATNAAAAAATTTPLPYEHHQPHLRLMKPSNNTDKNKKNLRRKIKKIQRKRLLNNKTQIL